MKWNQTQLELIERHRGIFETLERKPDIHNLSAIISFFRQKGNPEGYWGEIVDALITLLYQDKLKLNLTLRKGDNKVNVYLFIGEGLEKIVYIDRDFQISSSDIGKGLIADFKAVYPFLEIPDEVWKNALRNMR